MKPSKLISFAAGVLLSGAALADVTADVEYGGLVAGDYAAVHVKYYEGMHLAKDYSGNAGLMSVLVDGEAKNAFCVEVLQGADWSSRVYTVGSFGAEGALLSKLFDSSFGSVSTAAQFAGFQLAVWEVTHEKSGTYSMTVTSTSTFDAVSGGSSSAVGFANQYLQNALAYTGTAKYDLFKLSNGRAQDYVVWEPTTTGGDQPSVPEPSTVSLMLAGLGIAGIAARRRRQD